MKVGLMGFGKTGKAVASVLLESKKVNLQWVLRQSTRLEHRSVPEFLGVDSDEPGLIYSTGEYDAETLLEKHPVDFIVDFSSEQGVDYYADAAARRGVSIISAVSSYPDAQVKLLEEKARQTAVLHSPNITLGINFLMMASRVLQNIAPYTDIEIVEEHFKRKPEVSGTARKIAGSLGIEPSAIKTIRAGGIIGVHEVIFGFPYQVVRLRHESISREAFGNGIIFALENMLGKEKGLYTMEDLLLPYFQISPAIAADISQQKPWWRFW